MSSEAKEFIVSTEYPGYAFLGWATGDSSRFARRSKRRQPQNMASITSALCSEVILMTGRWQSDEMPGAGGLADILGEGEGPGHSDTGISGHGTGAVPGRRLWAAGL